MDAADATLGVRCAEDTVEVAAEEALTVLALRCNWEDSEFELCCR